VLGWLILTVLVGAVLQRVSGFGFGVVAAPVFVLLLGPVQGVMVSNVISFFNCLIIVGRVHALIEWRRVALLSAVSVASLVTASVVLRGVSAPTLSVLVGIVVIAGMTLSLVARRWRRGVRPWREGAWWPAVIASIFAGFGSIAAGVGGPPFGAYAVLDNWDPKRFAATIQPVFITNSLFAVLSRLLLTQHSLPDIPFWWWIVLVGTCIVALVVSDHVARRVSPVVVRAILVTVAYTGGLLALLQGLA